MRFLFKQTIPQQARGLTRTFHPRRSSCPRRFPNYSRIRPSYKDLRAGFRVVSNSPSRRSDARPFRRQAICYSTLSSVRNQLGASSHVRRGWTKLLTGSRTPNKRLRQSQPQKCRSIRSRISFCLGAARLTTKPLPVLLSASDATTSQLNAS